MDTVMGRMGGKVLLTFNLSFCNFIFARLLDNKTALEVIKHLYDIKNTLHQADKDFCQLFPVILTDNGGEFARVDDIEMDVRGESKLFFCDPNRSDQKGRIEKNHTLIRDILPKGTSFDNLTQEDINLVCSHVNSVKRAALNGKSAYNSLPLLMEKRFLSFLAFLKYLHKTSVNLLHYSNISSKN